MTDIQRWTDDQLEKMSDDDMRDCVRYVRGTLQGLGLKTDATILTHAICKSIDQSATIARLEAELERVRGERDGLREPLEGLIELHARPGEYSAEAWERIAEAFYRETGMLAPGKDQPAAMCGTPTGEERREAYDAWLRGRTERAVAALSARQNNDAASVAGKVE